MFDGIINGLKSYFPDKLIFWVLVAVVAHGLWQFVGMGGLDIMMMAKFVGAVVVGTFLATMLAGAAD